MTVDPKACPLCSYGTCCPFIPGTGGKVEKRVVMAAGLGRWKGQDILSLVVRKKMKRGTKVAGKGEPETGRGKSYLHINLCVCV